MPCARRADDLAAACAANCHPRLPGLDTADRAEIRQAFDRYAAKLLHPPLASLRNECRAGPPHGLLDALRRLFDLKE
ncbi:MAG: hypothetical protein ACK5SI_09640 [Planctomycetia bacterium]